MPPQSPVDPDAPEPAALATLDIFRDDNVIERNQKLIHKMQSATAHFPSGPEWTPRCKFWGEHGWRHGVRRWGTWGFFFA